VPLSFLGLALALIYLAFPVICAWKVVARNSFGGLWSEEFALFVVTLPGSPLAEKLFKRHDYVRLAAYLVFALLNAAALYFAGYGLEALFRSVS
jgi:hypothetical protein